MVYNWELEKARKWSTTQLRDRIWLAVACGQPVPGQVSVEALRAVLIERGEDGSGFHNT